MKDNQKLETAPLQTQDSTQETQDAQEPAAGSFLPINQETKLPYGAVAFDRGKAFSGHTVVTRLGEVVKLSEDMRFSDTRGKSVDFEWYVQDDGTILGHIECDSDLFIYNDELAFQQQYPRNFEPAPELAEPTPQLTHLQMVEQFHRAFGHTIATTPNIPDVEIMRFRLDFLREEVSELEQAAQAGDIIGLADAIVDIQYVLDGLILNSGLQNHMQLLTAEVHRANMAKLHVDDIWYGPNGAMSGVTGFDLATKTANFYKEKGMDCAVEYVGTVAVEYVGTVDMEDGWIVKRNDGKILKPIDWKEPDFTEILPMDEAGRPTTASELKLQNSGQ